MRVEIAPGDAPSFRFLADAYLRLGKLDEALRATERALELDPNYVQAAAQLEMLRALRTEQETAPPPDI